VGRAWTLVHLFQLPWRILVRRPRVALVQSTADTGYVRDLALIMICRLFRVPVVIHWHGTPDSTAFPGHGVARTLFDFGVARAARFIVLAESYRAYFAAVVPAAKLAVVPNFVDGRRWAQGPGPAHAGRRAAAPARGRTHRSGERNGCPSRRACAPVRARSRDDGHARGRRGE
jgi:glycosyltransferase involved in cell wall biosynthesis